MKIRPQWVKIGLGAMAFVVFCVGMRAEAPVITNIANIDMVPRLTIHSDLGSANQIQYSTNLRQTNWIFLTNLVVTQSPYWFADVAAPPAPFRFYRVVALNPAPTNMAFIPAGSFTMGDNLDGYSWALPLHTVYVSDFYMDRYEVTKALWDDVYNWAITHGYSFEHGAQGKAATHPAHSMTWYDGVKWCNARSEKEGRVPAYYTNATQTAVYRAGQVTVDNSWVKWNAGYRLPTEAEWEKAARGGASGHRFAWSDTDTITHSRANYLSTTNGAYDISATRGYHPTFNDAVFPYTSPVGFFAPNGYGLFDMSGNVLEICWDWYGVYSSSSQADPRGPTSPTLGTFRMIRGGSWDNQALVAPRSLLNQVSGLNNIGFRSVLPASQP